VKAAAEKAGFEVATEKDYKLGSPLERWHESCSRRTVYALKTGEVTKSPLKVAENFVVWE